MKPLPIAPLVGFIAVGLMTAGTVWEADRGFIGGDTIARPDIEIANTKTPSLYRAERYSMTGFTQELPAPVPLRQHGAGDASFRRDVGDGASSIDPKAQAFPALGRQWCVAVLWQVTASESACSVSGGTLT